MPSPMRLMLLCAASMAVLGVAGAAMADPAPAGDKANARGANGNKKAPAGEGNVRPAPRLQFERPAGCPYRDGKLELIV